MEELRKSQGECGLGGGGGEMGTERRREKVLLVLLLPEMFCGISFQVFEFVWACVYKDGIVLSYRVVTSFSSLTM